MINPDINYKLPVKPSACELCDRVMETLTKHHLIPRTRHRNKRTRRQFDKAAMRTRILWVCRPCHNHIHEVLTEKELATNYYDQQALLTHPELARFIAWIKHKPIDFKPTSRALKRS